MDIYGVTFHQTEGKGREVARQHDQRLTLLENVLAGISGTVEQSLVVLPAAFLRTSSLSSRDAFVRTCQRLASDARVALVFGIDLLGGPTAYERFNEPIASYGYVCRRSELAYWAACHLNGAAAPEERVLQRQTIPLHGIRLSLLISGEIFVQKIRRRIEADKPDLIIILAHAGITRRWFPALSILERTAPFIIVGQRLGSSTKLWEKPPRGWSRTTFGCTQDLTVHRFQLLPVQQAEVGLEQLGRESQNRPRIAHASNGASAFICAQGLTLTAGTGELLQ